jgi:hypothetical protein
MSPATPPGPALEQPLLVSFVVGAQVTVAAPLG